MAVYWRLFGFFYSTDAELKTIFTGLVHNNLFFISGGWINRISINVFNQLLIHEFGETYSAEYVPSIIRRINRYSCFTSLY